MISNSSPLIGLEQVGQIKLLQSLFGEVLIPEAVASEIAGSVVVRPWLKVQSLSRPIPIEAQRRSLGPGEREAIALAIECQAELLILDDDPARRIAAGIGIQVIGTIGVLLQAKERRLIKAVKPMINALLANRFFLSPEVYDLVLSKAGES